MLNELLERLEVANEMLEIQGKEGNYNFDEYSLGLYNGMEYIIATLENREPKYRNAHKIKFLNDKTIKTDGNIEEKCKERAIDNK